MSVRYILKESVWGFKRAKLSSFISVITISISLLLLGISSLVSINATRLIETFRSRVEMEVFLEEPLSKQQIEELTERVSSIKGVLRVVFISKDDAARIFKEEFGEDIADVLDFNPLPPSFKVYLEKEYQTAKRAGRIHRELMSIDGIQTVKYWKELLETLDRQNETVYAATLSLGIIIGLSAIFLVSNTIRLAIHAKRRIIRTMELVGATSSFIRFPFLLEGIMQGFVGGCITSGLLYVLVRYSKHLLAFGLEEFMQVDPVFYLLLIGCGTLLGLIGSVISVIRFIRAERAR